MFRWNNFTGIPHKTQRCRCKVRARGEHGIEARGQVTKTAIFLSLIHRVGWLLSRWGGGRGGGVKRHLRWQKGRKIGGWGWGVVRVRPCPCCYLRSIGLSCSSRTGKASRTADTEPFNLVGGSRWLYHRISTINKHNYSRTSILGWKKKQRFPSHI